MKHELFLGVFFGFVFFFFGLELEVSGGGGEENGREEK